MNKCQCDEDGQMVLVDEKGDVVCTVCGGYVGRC